MLGSSLEELRQRLVDNSHGMPLGVYSVCSAHRTVIEAALRQAMEDSTFALIESTSNQVDQYGGYTGLTPEQFTAFVKSIAAFVGFPEDRIIFGGDHLGPNAWQNEKVASAMEKALVLVKRYVEAGYKKIHLDASMYCADDSVGRGQPLPDGIVAKRAVVLCKACEESARTLAEKPVYIIGTEVPNPGGALGAEDTVSPTSVEAIRNTLDVHREAFYWAGLKDAWNRVIAAVVQPGVEFADRKVFYYDRSRTSELKHVLDGTGVVFEAHSTDYQKPSGLRELVKDHFCILKVGPWLTFRYREALFSLARIENELVRSVPDRSNLEQVLEKVMTESKPNYWEKHYRGSEDEKYFSRRYSLSDRSRYYWANRELSLAVEKLFSNLSHVLIPYSLISQYLPNLINAVSEGEISATPEALATANIRDTLVLYARAVGFRS
jgi:D-tagatose-1,6-bisphosphate aldolase subunit GatZ/KbaZ